MQQTPVVPIPKEERRSPDWYPLVGALALIAIAIILAILIARPDVAVAPTIGTDYHTNPELIVFENYQLEHAAAIETARWHMNPEVQTFRNYQVSHPVPLDLHENPEIGTFLRWREGQ